MPWWGGQNNREVGGRTKSVDSSKLSDVSIFFKEELSHVVHKYIIEVGWAEGKTKCRLPHNCTIFENTFIMNYVFGFCLVFYIFTHVSGFCI